MKSKIDIYWNMLIVYGKILILNDFSLSSGKPILTCFWDAETLDCEVNILYKFNYNISDTVSLGIHAATESHAGTYTCNVLDNEMSNFVNCTLSLSG